MEFGGLRHEGAVQEGGRGEGKRREGESCWKAAGDECFFIPGEGPGWQMKVGSDAIPDAAGGERSRGR